MSSSVSLPIFSSGIIDRCENKSELDLARAAGGEGVPAACVAYTVKTGLQKNFDFIKSSIYR